MTDLWPNSYLHTLNPFVIRFTETFGIRWYGLAYLAGFLFGYWFIAWLAKRQLTILPYELASDFIFTVALGTVIGGRLGYCIFYAPELFARFTSAPPFWGVLAIHQGGMASHGGIFGIICACLWFGRKHKLSALALFDLTTIGGAIGIFFGRLANFVNGELVGRVAPAGYSWAVKFPEDVFLWPRAEPARLKTLSVVVQELGVSQEKWDTIANTRAVEPYLGRIIDATQNGNVAVQNAIRPLLDGRYPSQLFEAGLEGMLIFCTLMLIWRNPRKPGVIAGWFLVIYPLVRIVGEQFRMPDPQIGFQALGLTRGQWLSVVMLLITSCCLVIWSKRPVEKIGGWGKKMV